MMSYEIMAVVTGAVIFGVAGMCYILESILLGQVFSKKGKKPVLAWIPGINYLIICQLAKKRTYWKWLCCFFVLFVLGSTTVRLLVGYAFVGCFMVWYWRAFYVLMQEESELNSVWLFLAVICLPVKLYVLYKMAD